MDFSEYKFRSHMVGKIVNVPKTLTKNQLETLLSLRKKGYENLTENQEKIFINLKNKLNESKTYKLSDANKKILSELSFAETFGRKVEINSPKLTKGIEVEKNSRDILTRVSGLFLTACKHRKTNSWVTGAIDIEPKNVIIDIKSSWSWSSFCKILQEKPNEINLRQGDCYMDLWGLKDFLLCHVLTDTPNKLIESEINRFDWNNNILDYDGNVREENIEDVKKIVSNHIFSRKGLEEFCDYSSHLNIDWFNDFIEIPEKDRVHMISHSFSNDRIEQRNKCITLARDYMNKSKPINNFNLELLK